MNENLDLVEILKDCPQGTKLYSTVYGEVEFEKIKDNSNYPIIVMVNLNRIVKEENLVSFTFDGRLVEEFDDAECVLFPSKDQRDWSKFGSKKQSKFDPNTLKSFDKVLTRNSFNDVWYCNFFSHCHSN